MAKQIRLLSVGSFDGQGAEQGDTLERNAMLVYAGKFESMDGPVEITADHINKLAEVHNGAVAKLSAEGGSVNLKFFPPVQLDHSTSAHDTVGRLVGNLVVGEHEGNPALFGKLLILGKENVAKVADGRWTHLSIGADLDTGKLNELSITPFPAAANASMLAKNKLSKGEVMDKEKLKKHLMDHKKMSEKEADEHLSKLSEDDEKKLAAECDENTEKLAAEAADKEKEEKEKGEKLAAAKTKLTELKGKMVSTLASVQLASRKVMIQSRLSKMVSLTKMTPAEVKKINLDEMSKESDAAIAAFFKGFELRENVVHVGMQGTVKAASIAQLQKNAKLKEKAEIEKEARANMPSMAKARLSDAADIPAHHIGTEGHGDAAEMSAYPAAEHLKHLEHLQGLLSEGKHDEAVQHLAGVVQKLKSHHLESAEMPTHPSEATMSAFTESANQLEAQVKDVLELVGPILGN